MSRPGELLATHAASLRDRRLPDSAREAALAGTVTLLVAFTVLLTITRPSRQGTRASAVRHVAVTHHEPPVPPKLARVPMSKGISRAEHVARGFLEGYLAYIYGHATARRIHAATGELKRSLATHPPRVSLDIRARHPRILTLHATASEAGQVTVTALINDGGVADYPIGLLLTSHRGRLLVGGLTR